MREVRLHVTTPERECGVPRARFMSELPRASAPRRYFARAQMRRMPAARPPPMPRRRATTITAGTPRTTSPTAAASSAVESFELTIATTYQKQRTAVPTGADFASVRHALSWPRTAPHPSVARTAIATKTMVGASAQPGRSDVPPAAIVRNASHAPSRTNQAVPQNLAQRGRVGRPVERDPRVAVPSPPAVGGDGR